MSASASIFSNPYLQGLIPLLAGGAGALGSSGTTTTNGSSTLSGSSSGTSSGSTTPNLSPEQQQIARAYGDATVNNINQGTNLDPYKFQQMNQIAGQGNNNAATIANSLASRGLSYSPAAATSLTQNELNTGNQQSQFLAGLPLLQHQLQQSNIAQGISGFSALPTATSFNGSTSANQNETQNTNQTTKVQQNPWAGLLSGLGAGLGLLSGKA